MTKAVPAEKLASEKWNKKSYDKKKARKGLVTKCKTKGCRWLAMPSSKTCLRH
jgi:hypothetical protein